MQSRIESKLRAEFNPETLIVDDDSEAHRGHGGYREGGGTHFNVKIRAKAFDNLSRIKQQRLVYAALSQEFKDGLHALSLDVAGLV